MSHFQKGWNTFVIVFESSFIFYRDLSIEILAISQLLLNFEQLEYLCPFFKILSIICQFLRNFYPVSYECIRVFYTLNNFLDILCNFRNSLSTFVIILRNFWYFIEIFLMKMLKIQQFLWYFEKFEHFSVDFSKFYQYFVKYGFVIFDDFRTNLTIFFGILTTF